MKFFACVRRGSLISLLALVSVCTTAAAGVPPSGHPAGLRYASPVRGTPVPAALRAALTATLATDASVLSGLDGSPLDWIEQELTASDGVSVDNFGFQVAIDGTTAIVGQPNFGGGPGAAYIFTESGGVWTQTQKLTPSDSAAADQFGISVGLSGTTAAIGAFNQNPGAVYVFVESGGTWSEAQKLTADDGAGNDSLGYSLTVSGTTVVGGAIATVGANDNQGAAYVFTETGGVWSQAQKLTASDGTADAYYGIYMASDENNIFVGATFVNQGIPGEVYVYNENGGVWSEVQTLHASDAGPGDGFGSGIGISGSSLIIGAPTATIGGTVSQGAAYVFADTGGVWQETQKLVASDGMTIDYFGQAVAIAGTTAVITALQGDGMQADQGAAYVFNESGGSWAETQKLFASDGASGDYFGCSVSLSGSTAIIGAMFASPGGNFWQGAAYMYSAPSNPPVASIVPGSLSFSLDQGSSGSDTLTIANAGGDDLQFSIAEAAATAPRVRLSPRTAAGGTLHHVPSKLVASRMIGVRDAAPWAPRDSEGELSFVLDDGTYEDTIGLNDGNSEFATIWLNRFAAPADTGAFTIDSISILWPQNTGGSLVGKQINLVAYYDADGDGDPTHAVRLGGDNFETIAGLDSFEQYTVNFSVPGDGDVYIGFENTYALGGSTPMLFPAAIDEGVSQGHSWVAGTSDGSDPDLDDLANNDLVGTIDSFGLPGNWLIRATGATGGDCSNPADVPWLAETPASGSVAGGASQDVVVTADATGLDAGTYNAVLCVATNDPVNGLIAVPVSMTVTADNDVIFQDGFDGI
jgi:hypothetical protein